MLTNASVQITLQVHSVMHVFLDILDQIVIFLFALVLMGRMIMFARDMDFASLLTIAHAQVDGSVNNVKYQLVVADVLLILKCVLEEENAWPSTLVTAHLVGLESAVKHLFAPTFVSMVFV
jgi:hypothetical protein